MKHFIPFWCLLIVFLCGCTGSQVEQAAVQLADRLLPAYSSSFVFEEVPSETDFFELEQLDAEHILIRGNDGVSLARGLNHYLREYAHRSVSWCGNNLSDLPQPLPTVSGKVRVEASFPYRYYLNYCTYSYSMPFWDWNRWEEEIDRMALQGVNMPLMAVYSQYAVWQNTLRRLNFSEQEIFNFLPGAGYEAWWLMGNLEQYGGPVTQQFIDRQANLQKKMLARMRALGMKPVFQAFYGMVPNLLKTKYPEAHIVGQGIWQTYQQPAFLDPNDPLFGKIADIYYEEQAKLFGEAPFYGGDPFHEGGVTDGIDITKAAQQILKAMRKHHPEAVWVLQGWGNNPLKALKDGVQPGDILILDLTACERPMWGGIQPRTVQPSGHQEHDWIWCALPNYGGKVGLHGKMSSYASGPVYAKHHPLGKHIQGVGMTSEGIGTIPVVYDMVYDMAWRTDSINISQWLDHYILYRYGQSDASCSDAWHLLSRSIYECHDEKGGPIESYFCARPSDNILHASSWGNAVFFYEPMDVLQAWQALYRSREKFVGVDTYIYDLVDLTRQVLTDYGKYVHQQMIAALHDRRLADSQIYSEAFLQLIRDEDHLLSTRHEFMLGPWLADAERAGSTEAEKHQFVLNAKRQITTWTGWDSSLHDYANKEWSGLLVDFYLPRWQAYIDYNVQVMQGKKAQAPDYPALEQAWVEGTQTYPLEPSETSSLSVVEQLYNRYFSEMEAAWVVPSKH